MLRDVSERDLSDIGARHRRCPRRCCSRRSACSRSSTPTPSSPSAAPPPRSGLPFILSTAASHSLEDVAAAMRPGASRWYQLYWPKRARARRELRRARRRRRLRGDRRHARHLAARLAPARPAERLPAVPQRRGRRQLLQRPGVPRRARASRPRRTPAPAIGHWAYQFANPRVDLGRPRVAARADRRCRSCSRGSSTPTTRGARSTRASTG